MLRIFYKNNQMRITDMTRNSKWKNLFTDTVDKRWKLFALLTIGQKSDSQKNC